MANLLANIFGKSPVRPLEQHVGIAYRCTKQLNGFFRAVVAGKWDRAAEIRDAISALEHEADDLKKEIRMHLPKKPGHGLAAVRPTVASSRVQAARAVAGREK